jgi:hypothetical protein
MTHIVVETDSFNNESSNEEEYEQLKAKAVVQWIINFNNALITNSSHMKLINIVSYSISKQDYNAMILKASTNKMWDDLKTCAVSKTEISYEIRSSVKGNKQKFKNINKSLSRIKSDTVCNNDGAGRNVYSVGLTDAPNVDKSNEVFEAQNTNNDGAERNVYSVGLTDAPNVDKSNEVFETRNTNNDGAEQTQDNDGSKKSNHQWFLLSDENINQIISDASDKHKIDSDKESSSDAQNVDKSNRVFETQNRNDNGVVRNVHSGGLSDAQNVDLVVVLPSVKDDVIVVLPNDVSMLMPLTKTLFTCKNNVNIKVIDALRVAGYPISDATGWLEIDSVDYEIKETLQSLVHNNDIFAFSVHFYSSLHSLIYTINGTQATNIDFHRFRFTRGVDIFKKKYLYIPILIEKHYRLVCVIGLDQLTNDNNTQIVILVMDSLENDNNHIINEISK